jgi:poly(A) polymerase
VPCGNALLGTAVVDVDIATTAAPAQTLAAAKAAGLTAIPTGLAHGTVTLVSGGVPHQVTTLRRDVATDGRHAVVAFTDNWAEDARRRDFTINALYCGADGTLHDPLGGYGDLLARRVRFIGDASARIAEDYLRILRFFRFTAEYAAGPPDADGLAACGLQRAGLERLSAERIQAELKKILLAPRAGDMAELMHAHGFWTPLLGLAVAPAHLKQLIALDIAGGGTPSSVTRLAALAVCTAEDADQLSARLKLSTHDWTGLAAVGRNWWALNPDVEPRRLRRRLYHEGLPAVVSAGLVAWARRGAGPEDARWTALLKNLKTMDVPAFPLRGRDFIDRGVPPGPVVGAALARLEAWWIDGDFTASRAALLAQVDEQLQAFHSET